MAAAWIAAAAPLPVIIFDTKYEDTFLRAVSGRFKITENASDTLRLTGKVPVVVYRPTPTALLEPEKGEMNDLLLELLDRGNLMIVVDEGYQLGKSSGLIGVLTRGRSRGIITLVASQRPRWLTRFAFSEANHYLIFRLQDLPDRLRVAEFSPYPVNKVLADYNFWYWRLSEDLQAVYKLTPSFLNSAIDYNIWI